MRPRRSKWKNKRVFINGEWYDSKKEHRYHLQLMADPTVESLSRQVVFHLVDKRRDWTGYLEREVKYKADFVIKYRGDPYLYVDDVKGAAVTITPDHIIKRKLFKQIYEPQGYRFRELIEGVQE